MSPLLAAFLGMLFGFGTGVTLMYALIVRNARPSHIARRVR
jgi:hypothetical protein